MKNRTILVTGAAINTGVAIVKKFASEGYDVVFTDRELSAVKAAEEAYKQEFPKVRIKGMVLEALNAEQKVDEKAVHDLFQKLDAENIFIYGVVLNAADMGLGIEIFKNQVADFSRVMNVNVLWNYCILEKAAERMRKNGGGSIVFINSNTAYRAIPDRIAYAASKGAQLSMMRALALDLGKYNIRVNAVLPGMIRTDRWLKNPEFYERVPSRFTPLRDVANGEDVAEAAYYLTIHARNSTGAELSVDGGNMIQLYPIIPEDKK